MEWNDEHLIEVLKNNGVVVMPTDTLYGIVGKALNTDTVNRIYKMRNRNPDKPMIILIGAISELEKFSIILSENQKVIVEEYWQTYAVTSSGQPRPTSIIVDCPLESLSYLHRGLNTLAFRVPALPSLRDLLMKVGPLIAPSANLEAMPPAQNLTEAKKYFGDSVDLYVNGGDLSGDASKIIKLQKDGSVVIIRG